MRRFLLIVAMGAVLVAILLALSGPALAYDVFISAYSPGGAPLWEGPLHQGDSYPFKYTVSDEMGLIPTAGVPATVYISGSRTHKVASQFETWMVPGAGVHTLSPEWQCNLRVGHYLWTLWPTLPAVSFASTCNGFDVVK